MSTMSTLLVNGEQAARTTAGAPDSPPAAARASTRRGGGPPLERVTVNLSPRSVAALDSLVELTQETKTDSINRALQVYAYLQQLFHDGGALYVRSPVNSELERLRIL
jgi:hypothetical protein